MYHHSVENARDPVLDVLITALAELPEPGEPIGPENWPAWTDDRVGYGAPLSADEMFDDLPPEEDDLEF